MVNNVWPKIVGVSTIVFPLMLLAGFLLHPDLLSFRVTRSAADLIGKFHHQWTFHVGHLVVFASVPFIIASMVYIAGIPSGKGEAWVFYGGIIGVIGAVILAGDKGALCLVLSAFDKLPDSEFSSVVPALTTIVERKGLLKIFYLLPLLPLGAAIQIVGLIKTGSLPPVLGVLTIAGLVLLNNPDIEIISSVGALLMCAGYVPLGISILAGGGR
jgi:hypothetical protein